MGCTDPSVLESLIPFPPISRWFVCKAADSPLCQAQELSCLALPSHLSGGFCLSFLSARKEMLRLQTNPRGLWDVVYWTKAKQTYEIKNFCKQSFADGENSLLLASENPALTTRWCKWLWGGARTLREVLLLLYFCLARLCQLCPAVAPAAHSAGRTSSADAESVPCDQSRTHSWRLFLCILWSVITWDLTSCVFPSFLQCYQHNAGDVCCLLLPVVSINNALPLNQSTFPLHEI